MNQYGVRAKRYWEESLPARYRALADPETYFGELGEELAERVHERMWEFAGSDRPGEGYLEKVGRLQMARLEAEGEVMREALPLPEGEDESAGEPEDGAGG